MPDGSIGARLKALRLDRGLTQDEVGQRVLVSKQTLYKYENDIVTNIPVDKIELLAEVYHVTPAYIMGWENPSSLTTGDQNYIQGTVSEEIAPYGKHTRRTKKENDLDALLERGGYLTYSDKPLTEQQKQVLREFVKVLIKEESSDVETTSDRH